MRQYFRDGYAEPIDSDSTENIVYYRGTYVQNTDCCIDINGYYHYPTLNETHILKDNNDEPIITKTKHKPQIKSARNCI